MRSPTTRAWSADALTSRATISSPPKRPITSPLRSWPVDAWATAASTASPATWPTESFTALKRSTSNSTTDAEPSRCRACSSRIAAWRCQCSLFCRPVLTSNSAERRNVGTCELASTSSRAGTAIAAYHTSAAIPMASRAPSDRQLASASRPTGSPTAALHDRDTATIRLSRSTAPLCTRNRAAAAASTLSAVSFGVSQPTTALAAISPSTEPPQNNPARAGVARRTARAWTTRTRESRSVTRTGSRSAAANSQVECTSQVGPATTWVRRRSETRLSTSEPRARADSTASRAGSTLPNGGSSSAASTPAARPAAKTSRQYARTKARPTTAYRRATPCRGAGSPIRARSGSAAAVTVKPGCALPRCASEPGE